MRFKTYTGPHTQLPQLMDEARQELGPEAIIKIEYFLDGGFLGLGARKMVKVTAGVEESPGESPFSISPELLARDEFFVPRESPFAPPGLESHRVHGGRPNGTNGATPKPAPPPPPVVHSAAELPLFSTVDEPQLPEITPAPPKPLPPIEAPHTESIPPSAESPESPALAEVLAELKSLRAEVQALSQRPGAAVPSDTPELPIEGLAPVIAAAYRQMVDAETSPALARRLAEHAGATLNPEQQEGREVVRAAMRERFIAHCLDRGAPRPATSTSPRVVMLLGPTGVGKTTTLAKLAASHALLDEKKIALITADTYRIAAIDQLRTFAQIINLPLEVVFDPHEFTRALQMHSSADLVLVDTAGQSPTDEQRLTKLKAFLEADYPVEAYLVVAATTKGPDLRLVLERFRPLGLDGVILTKLDETRAAGALLDLLWDTQMPLLCLTNGQNVPDDLIRGPEAELLGRLVDHVFAS